MLRLSVSELSTYRWTFEEDVLHYSAYGYNAIGIWRPKLRVYGEEKGIELIRECGLGISSLQFVGGFTGNDGRSFREALHDGFDAIQLAADVGAETVILLSGGRGGHTRNHSQRLLRTALQELSEAAQAVGVQIAMEPMHIGCALETSFINTVPQCLDLIAEINNPHLGITFDCYHLGQDSNMISWLDSIVPFVRLVQLGDAKHAPMGEQNRCMLGEGNLPLRDIVATFQAGGYQGYYEIEMVGQGVEHLQYEQLLGRAHEVAAAL